MENLVVIDKQFIAETLEFIEGTPAKGSSWAYRYERSRQLWRNRNHFLDNYLVSLKTRYFDANGHRMTEVTRDQLFAYAVFQSVSPQIKPRESVCRTN